MPSQKANVARRLPVGAELVEGGAHFRVWAPACGRVEVVFEDGAADELAAEGAGWFSAFVEGRGAGELYRLRLDGAELVPDPASRFQPRGVHGPSQLVDPAAFAWSDATWPGLSLRRQVFYELHLGAFTREGTWQAAARRLPELARLGITAVELMPVADTPGKFNWGYDGVALYAPASKHGRPDDFRAFVDAAHALGVGVLLDVVYNHLGPDGNYLARVAPPVFDRRRGTEWGEALNYDGPDSGPVREFMTSNAAYWIGEFHLDGLRFDATQNIYDESATHVLAEFSRKARAAAAGRRILLVAENETQEAARFTAPVERGGYGFDAVWNDDWHHSFRVALTGRREAYYLDYTGSGQELAATTKRGYLYQGQWYAWQKKKRGTDARGVAPEAFVAYLENHDQVANCTPAGTRLVGLTSPGRLRAATAALLLSPGTPLLFMGQESGARERFTFFADHKEGLAEAVAKGRRQFMGQFPSMAEPLAQDAIAQPRDPATFESCRLLSSAPDGDRWRLLHADLIALRRWLLPSSDDEPPARIDTAALGPAAFAVRYETAQGPRLLLVNLGPDVDLPVVPEPLLAPPEGARWVRVWSSEEPRYGGCGTMPVDESRWRLQADCARLLKAQGGPDAAA